MNTIPNLDISIGRVELLGRVVHFVEQEGQAVTATTDKMGRVIVIDRDDLSADGWRRLIGRAIGVLVRSALAHDQAGPSKTCRAGQASRRSCRRRPSCRGRKPESRQIKGAIRP